MNWLANAIIWVSLALASFASVSAYWPSLEVAAASVAPLTLTEDAGEAPDDSAKPLVQKGTQLSTDIVAQLQAANVKRVQVKEFAWSRWSGRYWFIVASVGLIAGAVMLRRGNAAEVTASQEIRVAADGEDTLLSQVVEQLDALISDATDSQALLPLADIVTRIEQIQLGPLASFVESLPQLVSRLGVRRYAQVMDRFAASERLLNRSWSGAVDGADEDCRDSLRQSREALGKAAEMLK